MTDTSTATSGGPVAPEPPTGPTKKKKDSGISGKRILWTVAALVALIIVNVIKDPSFLSIGINHGALNGPLIDVLRNSAPFLLIAVGMTLVVSTAGIDLSVGAVMAVGGAVAMQFLSGAGEGLGSAILAIGLSLVVCAAVGAFNGAWVSLVGLQPFITTLIMMLAGRGIAKVITDGQNVAATNSYVDRMATGAILGIPTAWIFASLLVVLIYVLTRRTALGTQIESVGLNREAARMAGIRPKAILFSVYVISGVLAGAAGLFAVGNVMRVEPTATGLTYEMDAILAVVIGGTSLLGGKFSLGGAYLGALIISLLEETIVWLGIPNAATPAFKAMIVILVCVLQSDLMHKVFARRKRAENGGGKTEKSAAQSTKEALA